MSERERIDPGAGAARPWIGLVLAAGKGTRMKSDRAKVLHEIEGKSLLGHVLDTAAELGLSRTIVVVGHQAEEVRGAHAAWEVETVLQEPQLGTGHAVIVAAPLLRGTPPDADCLVLYGDVPLLRATTLGELMERHRLEGNGVTVLTAEVDDPAGYGRVFRDAAGRFERIVEDRDLRPEDRGRREINSGIYAFPTTPRASTTSPTSWRCSTATASGWTDWPPPIRPRSWASTTAPTWRRPRRCFRGGSSATGCWRA